jgi:epidermal growth factor receptor substrate 15
MIRVAPQIWQIADTEDKGFLTPAGFYIILRLIGYAQAGRPVSAALALKSEANIWAVSRHIWLC